MNLIVTLLERDALRVANVERMKKKFPNIEVITSFDALKQWDEIRRFIEDWEVPLRHTGRGGGLHLNKKGKVARWATLIKAIKYVYDLKLGNTVILEDDVNLPSDFDFCEDKWEDGRISKLSQWGEGYGLNHTGAEEFLRTVSGARLISLHSDEFIMHECNPSWVVRDHIFLGPNVVTTLGDNLIPSAKLNENYPIINSKLGGHLIVATNKGHLVDSPVYTSAPGGGSGSTLPYFPIGSYSRTSPLLNKPLLGGSHASASDAVIPKVIFTSFRDEREDNETVDTLLTEWEEKNPDLEVKYFSDNDLDEYFESHPRREVFEMIKSGVARADYFRACYLQSHGGTWFDFDLESFEFQLPAEVGLVLYDMGYGSYSYMLISSQAAEPLWDVVLTEVDKRVINPELGKSSVLSITGPHVLQDIIGTGGAADDTLRTRKGFTFFYAKGPKVDKKTKVYRENLRAGYTWWSA